MTLNLSAALKKAKGESEANLALGLARADTRVPDVTSGAIVGAVYADDRAAMEANPPVAMLSLDVIRPQFEDYKKSALDLEKKATELAINSEESLQVGVEIVGSTNKIIKVVTAEQTRVTQNAKDFIAAVKGIVDQITGPLKRAADTAKLKNRQYKDRLELERNIAQKKAEEAAKKLQEELNADAAKHGVEAPQVVQPTIAKTGSVVRAASGTTSYEAKSWKGTITDEEKVPREYCTPDMKLINKAIKEGVRTIPGVEIKEITNDRYRS